MKAASLGFWIIVAVTPLACDVPKDRLHSHSSTPVQGPSTPTPVPSASPSPTPSPDRVITRGRKLKTKEFRAVSHKLRYDIKGDYPEIRPATDRRARKFNAEIKRRFIKQYRWALVPTLKDLRDQIRLGSNEDPLNTAEFTYELLFANDDLLSIRFHDVNYSYPAAHPGEDYFSLNFDLRKGVVLRIKDIFKAKVNFRQKLVASCQKKLEGQGILVFPDAVAADFRRHVEWNITRDGLVVSFDRCVVSACADGERSVTIPYHELQGMTSLRLQRVLSR